MGDLLAVLAHDPAARYDVPAWCRMRGQEYVGEERAADGAPRYVVRRLSLTQARCLAISSPASSP
ncbi:sulfurtransferase TusA family protein [Nocardioides convexus]|uniref:sulfurtransferase TusA family protein n=1 Tax=Nocardioides convexus TaxID=2712224 RepID=UPI002418B00B|nr:sulfurtransferase TusA family protein [Nocardioides convexus]